MPDSGADPEPDADPEPPDPEPGADRRSFLRQLSTDAVWTAGRLAGASAALRRSLVAAGGSAIGSLEASADVEASVPGPVGAVPPPRPASDPPVAVAAAVAPAPVSTPDPVTALTPLQHAFLAGGTKATLAVNDPGGHPLLASSIYHWDGALIRVPARDFTARTTGVDRDPRVSLLIDDPASDAWVAVTGIASLVYGDQVETELRLILGKYHDGDDVAGRWDALKATGDQLVILVRPTRFVWRSA
jgi:hypothetical protein